MVLCSIVLQVKRTVIKTEGLFLSSSLFCEYHNTEISQFSLSFALQAKEIWGIRKGHSACFHACSGDRLYLGCCLFWLPLEFLISHLYDEAVDGDKHFSFFLLQDSSDVTLCLHQQHDLFLYFAHDLMDFFVLPKILPSSWREKKMSFFKFLFMQLLHGHNLLHRLHLVLSLDMKRERKRKK